MNFTEKILKFSRQIPTDRLPKSIADSLGLRLANSDVRTFSDGEISVSINETVRGSDVFIVQSTLRSR